MNILLACIGTWIISDGIFSLSVAIRYYPEKQSWLYDHSIRLFRIIFGVVIIICGVLIND